MLFVFGALTHLYLVIISSLSECGVFFSTEVKHTPSVSQVSLWPGHSELQWHSRPAGKWTHLITAKSSSNARGSLQVGPASFCVIHIHHTVPYLVWGLHEAVLQAEEASIKMSQHHRQQLLLNVASHSLVNHNHLAHLTDSGIHVWNLHPLNYSSNTAIQRILQNR